MKGDKRIMDFENNDMEGIDEELDNIIILNDEDGNEVQFEFLDLIELDGEEYVVLLPVEDDEEEDGEVVILKVEDTDSEDEESYVSVDVSFRRRRTGTTNCSCWISAPACGGVN